MSFATRSQLRYKEGGVHYPLDHDDQGNVKNVAIRGPALEFGDGARADAAGAVALGPSVVNSTANSVALGSGSATPFVRFSAKGAATEAANAATVNATAGKITLSGALTAGAGQSVVVTNSYVSASSVIFLTSEAVTATADATRDAITCDLESVGANTFTFHVYNGDANNTSAAPIIHFLVV